MLRLVNGLLQLLPDLLSRVTGAFFIPVRTIRAITEKRGQWPVERSIGPVIAIQPIADGPFAQEMQRFIESRL